MNIEEEKNKSGITNWKLYLGSLVVLLLWLVSYPIIKYYVGSNDASEIGVFGDSFGAINALFSGLAFVGLIFTIYLQKNELKLQRNELRLQRNELKENREQLRRTAAAQEKTEKLMNKQLKLANKAAKIDALTTIIESYNNDIYGDSEKRAGSMKTSKRDHYLDLLNKMVKDINEITKEVD